MLKSSKQYTSSRYLQWYHTRDTYLAITAYFLGMDESLMRSKYRRNSWVLAEMKKDRDARLVAEVNRLRLKACSAQLSGDNFEDVVMRLQDLAVSFNLNFKFSDHTFETAMRCAYALVNLGFRFILKYYPPIITRGVVLHTMLCGFPEVTIDVKSSAISGGKDYYITGCCRDFGEFLDDSGFITYLLSGETRSSHPFTREVTDAWRVNISCDACVLVDGENIGPCDFDIFMRLQFRKAFTAKVPIRVFVSEENKEIWKYLESKYSRSFDFQVIHVSRVNSKSRVDMALVNAANHAYYRDSITEFYILSCDSDFSSLMDTFQDASIHYVIRRSITSDRWVKLLSSKRMKYYMIDESCTFINKRIFYTNYIIESFSQIKLDPFCDQSKWSQFITAIGLNPEWLLCSIARRQLQNMAQHNRSKKRELETV